jgi:alcohol dehydrogenase
MMAKLAVLDPELTASCPRLVAVGSGLDAMVHSLEAFMTTGGHPVVHGIARQAWTLLFRAFPRAVNDAAATDARMDMLLGSYLAGITLMYSGGGIAGALSYPLGAEFDVPHGLAGGLILRGIIAENIAGGYTGFSRLQADVHPEDGALSPAEASRKFLAGFERLIQEIGAPAFMPGAATQADTPYLVTRTLEQRAAVLRNNPVTVDAGLLSRILNGALQA